MSLPYLIDLIQNDHRNINQKLSMTKTPRHKPVGHLPLMFRIHWEIDIKTNYGSRYLLSLMGKRNWKTRLFWLSSPTSKIWAPPQNRPERRIRLGAWPSWTELESEATRCRCLAWSAAAERGESRSFPSSGHSFPSCLKPAR